MEKFLQLAMENKDYIIEMRRYLHQNPEPSEQEVNTCKKVCEELKKMGLEPKVVCTSQTGVMCDIKGSQPGKTIALRADMDALSVQELNDVCYKSTVDGLMHACGHDAHTATLLGAAKILSACKDDFKGTVRLLFQPAEETAYGAKAMIEAGCLDGVDATMGTHVNSSLESGKISVQAGPRLAAANWFKYRLIGKPGHGALPHQGIDAGLAACSAALNLQHLVSREFPSDKPLVITIGKIEAGTRFNVIAAEATLEGTVRCFDPDVFREVQGQEGEDDDVYLDEFANAIEPWIIEELKKIGMVTAKDVLKAPREMLVSQADLEEETVDDVLRILKEEFEE